MKRSPITLHAAMPAERMMRRRAKFAPERVLRTGCLAYLDLLSGLVPCRVTSIQRAAGPERIGVIVTATRPCYPSGTTMSCPSRWVVPRTAVRFRKHGAVILSYRIETDHD